jgi:uncharacterized protein (DUF362 family)
MESRPNRRAFLKTAAAGTAALAAARFGGTDPSPAHPLVHRVHDVPVPSFTASNRHPGVDSLLFSLAGDGLRLYKSATAAHPLAAANGLIGANDVVLLKVNAQWEYRGCTNSDVVRGIVQRLIEHPDGFTGEVVIIENGQGRGSLLCDTTAGCDGGTNEVHANAENESHSFSWLCTGLFKDTRVGQRLLDSIRTIVVPAGDHTTQGYRTIGTTSYPCFQTPRGTRVELREGIWTGSAYDSSRLKLINVPVLKDHKDLNVTGCTKHMYGLFTSSGVTYDFHLATNGGLLMADFWTLVRPPTLNILDCTWVSHASLCGYPASTTSRADMLVGGLDPCAIDAWAARHILLPISGDPAHDPDIPGLFRTYLTTARTAINNAGGLNGSLVTITDSEMRVTHQDARDIQVRMLRSGSDIRVLWAGGMPPYTVQRDTNSQFTAPVTRATGLYVTDFADTGAATGPTYYYRILGS